MSKTVELSCVRARVALDLNVCRAVFQCRGFDYKRDSHSRSPRDRPKGSRGANRLPNFMGSSISNRLPSRRPPGRRGGSCKHAATRTKGRRRRRRGTHLGVCCGPPRATVCSAPSLPPQSVSSGEPRSNLGYSISRLSWHQKVEARLLLSDSGPRPRKHAPPVAVGPSVRANSQIALEASGSKHQRTATLQNAAAAVPAGFCVSRVTRELSSGRDLDLPH